MSTKKKETNIAEEKIIKYSAKWSEEKDQNMQLDRTFLSFQAEFESTLRKL